MGEAGIVLAPKGGVRGIVVVAVALLGCADAGTDREIIGDGCSDGTCDLDVGRTESFCTAFVSGQGTLDVEYEYLAQVIACENYDGPREALEAQAIAARSYLYYKLASTGGIGDGQHHQVFSCDGKLAQQRHRDAVGATAGRFLKYEEATVAGFYVSGAYQRGPTCRGGTFDPLRSEKHVTYNEGKRGDQIKQSTLGFRSTEWPVNRGAMSQNGANCLAEQGYSSEEILRFYYGLDIEIAQSTGPCSTGVVPWAEDIGEACFSEFECQERCEQTVTDEGTTGFCSAPCDWNCSDTSVCVDLGAGEGRCALVADKRGACDGVPGTEPTVLESVKTQLETVCAPKALGISCTVNTSDDGECINTEVSTCSGTLYSNKCPGDSSIRCCVE